MRGVWWRRFADSGKALDTAMALAAKFANQPPNLGRDDQAHHQPPDACARRSHQPYGRRSVCASQGLTEDHKEGVAGISGTAQARASEAADRVWLAQAPNPGPPIHDSHKVYYGIFLFPRDFRHLSINPQLPADLEIDAGFFG